MLFTLAPVDDRLWNTEQPVLQITPRPEVEASPAADCGRQIVFSCAGQFIYMLRDLEMIHNDGNYRV